MRVPGIGINKENNAGKDWMLCEVLADSDADNGLLVLHLACTARQQASAYVTIFEEFLV